MLVVTIDENEVSPLGVLLEEMFPKALRQMVTIVINPSGASNAGLSRVEEYAYFIFLGGALPRKLPDDLLSATTKRAKKIRWESLMRGGSSWYRSERPNLCYPILLDPQTHKIVGVGDPFSGVDESNRPKKVKGKLAAWPVRDDGRLGIWRVDGAKLMSLVDKGYAYTSSANTDRGTWTIRYLMAGTIKLIDAGDIINLGLLENGQARLEVASRLTTVPKTVWYRGQHTAGGAGGTHLVSALLGEKGLFTYPKSVYAVMDTIDVAIGNRENAVIVDFFAGTGTTLHATALLNRRDGGRRQCVLVTNNEVNGATATELRALGLRPGDAGWEERGVFHSATKPRCLAAITGARADGKPIEGLYDDGTEISAGLEENVEFFDLTYIDRTDVERGVAFSAIAPILWLAAGGCGDRIQKDSKTFAISPTGGYAILFNVTAWPMLAQALEGRDDVGLLYVVTDSLAHYHQVVAEVPPEIQTRMLYEDYLENFQINTGGRR